jgi:hypothetical protein
VDRQGQLAAGVKTLAINIQQMTDQQSSVKCELKHHQRA